MKLKSINLVNSILNEIRPYTLTNEGVIANMLCLLVGNSFEVRVNDILEESFASGEKLERLLYHYIPDDTVYQAVKTLLSYKVSNKVFDLLSHEILEYTIWKDIRQTTVDYLVDIILCEQLKPEIQTPSWLNDLSISLLNPVEGTFYDGVAGGCGTAVEVYRYSKKNHGSIHIYTQEINEFLYLVSVVRTFLEEIPNISNACGDTIKAPAYLMNEKLQTFDYSIMFPTLGMMRQGNDVWIDHDIFARFLFSSHVRIGWDWIFALHQVASLNENGKGILCMFSGALFNAQSKLIRTEIIQSGMIECIIAIPANSLSYSAVPINLVIFNKDYKRDRKILMIDAQELMDTNALPSPKKRFILNEEGIKRITEIYIERIEEVQVSKMISTSEIVDADLTPTRYVKRITFDLLEFGKISISPNLDDVINNPNWKTIKDVAEVRVGVNNSKIAEQFDEGNIKIIKLSDVQSGKLILDDMKNYRLIKDINIEKYKVRSGDILLSCKGPAIKTCMIPQAEEYIVASSNFITLRADPKVIHPMYLRYYLESPVGIYFIKSKQVGSSIVMLNIKDVNDIPIPYIPLQEQIQLVDELQSKEEHIQEEIMHLTKMLKESKLDFYQKVGLINFMTIIE